MHRCISSVASCSQPDIRQSVYEKLNIPVLVLYDRDNFVRFDTLPAVASSRDNWHLARIAPTKGLPHFEKLPEVVAALDKFWHELVLYQQD